jgi:regulator of sigma E protease
VTPTALSRSLGVGFPFDQVTIQTSLGEAVTEGWNQSVVWGKRIFLMLGALARQDVAPRNLAGPVGIVHIGKRVADEGFSKLLYVLAMISINLGVFNLLPFPILDGGHLLFLLIEKLKGSPVDERVQGLVHLGAFVILIGLALYVTYHDILRLFG